MFDAAELAFVEHHGALTEFPDLVAAGRFVLDDPANIIEWRVESHGDAPFTVSMNYFTFADAWDAEEGREYSSLREARAAARRLVERAMVAFALAQQRHGYTDSEDVANRLTDEGA